MRIKTFNLLATQEAEEYTLKNCPVVIDASNYFYSAYKDSGMPFAFGCECDKYAEYIRELLSMFEKANVNCYFLFKGGIPDINANIDKHSKKPSGKDYDPSEKTMFIEPIFAQDVCLQVLKEMGIKYMICKMEVKKQCIDLAHALNCPIISYDIEYCFSNVPYILSNTLSLNEENNGINCRLFRLNTFLDKYSLTKEKLVYFILLRDEKIFPEGTFFALFRNIDVRLSQYRRSICLMRWLSNQRTRDCILKVVFRYIDNNNQKLFLEKEKDVRAIINPQIEFGMPLRYLKDEEFAIEIDDDRFEYDIASGRISKHYINLKTDNFIKYNDAVYDPESINAFFTALDIIKFAYVMLTDANNSEFTIYGPGTDTSVIKVDRNYDYDSIWTTIMKLTSKSRNYLTAKKDYDKYLELIPNDAKLLFIALTYCAVKHEDFTDNEVFSVLLSYIMLSTTSECCNDMSPEDKSPDDTKIITSTDTFLAIAALSIYFETTDKELSEIFDRKILHPLVEFQYCLQHLNYLNALCGEPYEPTNYSKTYNGTFVYKILYKIKKQHNNKLLHNCNITNYMDFVRSDLKCAPGVTAFLLDIMESLKGFKGEMADDIINFSN